MILHLSYSTYSPFLPLFFILTFRPLGLYCPESKTSILFFIRTDCAWGRRRTIAHLRGILKGLERGGGEGKSRKTETEEPAEDSIFPACMRQRQNTQQREKRRTSWTGEETSVRQRRMMSARGWGGLMTMGPEALHYPSAPLAELHQTPPGYLQGLDEKLKY